MAKPSDTPCLKWFTRKSGRREAYWICHGYVREMGFIPKTQRLWSGVTDPTAEDMENIKSECRRLYGQMRSFILYKNRKRPRYKRGLIYFISAGDLVKIGYTENVEVRLKTIQKYSPTKLELIATFDDKTQMDEVRLHRQFDHCRAHGEWFRFTDEIREYIALNGPLSL
ncbi:GIY-YIG nuclease family protein [Rhodoplanes roseus]|uniref:Bacteriophage T5 Orf172 DNA-binding domain-containing protein n=1 Tax=Rhodoplanes roseus TaxID=29409 RepID=A0A327KXP1_9BRAD|nr:GIY-YIG nuclease family protein [Rhodoplanes roseus]RAI42814.1 hypothetical protein CH341_17635 [Rhodoplanes roseus]